MGRMRGAEKKETVDLSPEPPAALQRITELFMAPEPPQPRRPPTAHLLFAASHNFNALGMHTLTRPSPQPVV